MVERFLHTHTNLVLRESLDVSLHHLLPWDLSSMSPNQNPRFVRQFKCLLFLLIPTYPVVSQVTVEDRDTQMRDREREREKEKERETERPSDQTFFLKGTPVKKKVLLQVWSQGVCEWTGVYLQGCGVLLLS